LYALQRQDQKGFAAGYTALLQNGFDAPAGDLLEKFIGFGLDKDALLKGSLELMKNKTAELRGC
jgi:oligoendopeptidase F